MTRDARPCISIAAALALVAAGSIPAEARLRHHRYGAERPLLVRQVKTGLIPGTYSPLYDRPGYGCLTSVFAGNIGGCGTGWAYDGGPGWGYR